MSDKELLALFINGDENAITEKKQIPALPLQDLIPDTR